MVTDPADLPALAVVLRRTVLRLARELRREVGQLGVTGGQTLALGLIRESPGSGVRELARRENISSPGMTAQVARLERAGLVRRVPVDGDRRRSGLALTAKGEDVLERILDARADWLAQRLERLDDGEVRTVAAVAKLLSEDRRA